MPTVLYYVPYSAPCRAVLLTAKILNIELELKHVDLQRMEHMAPEFIKINIQHKVPVLVEEDGFTLSESRAIIIYLAEKYDKSRNLYPKDPKARAMVNHRLFFDMGTLYQRCLNYYVPIWKKGKAAADPYKKAKVDEAFEYLNTYLEGQKYVTGDQLTLADISIVASVASLTDCKVDIEHENVKRWYETMKNITGFEEAITQNHTDINSLIRF